MRPEKAPPFRRASRPLLKAVSDYEHVHVNVYGRGRLLIKNVNGTNSVRPHPGGFLIPPALRVECSLCSAILLSCIASNRLNAQIAAAQKEGVRWPHIQSANRFRL